MCDVKEIQVTVEKAVVIADCTEIAGRSSARLFTGMTCTHLVVFNHGDPDVFAKDEVDYLKTKVDGVDVYKLTEVWDGGMGSGVKGAA